MRLRAYRSLVLLLVAMLPVLLIIVIGVYFRRDLSEVGTWVSGSSTVTFSTRDAGGKSKVKLAYGDDGRAELGQYSIKIFDPLTRTTLRTDFQLEGVTSCEDKHAFQKFMQNNYRFFREQVTIAVRSSSSNELADPQLRVVKKKVIARVNRALGQPFLASVDLAKFTIDESSDAAVVIPRKRGKDTNR